MANLADLIAQKAALEQKIAEARRAERAGAIAQIQSLMAAHGLTLADLAGKASAAAPAKEGGARKGSKVPAKYRDPDTGTTWSGRGLHPKWLQAALKSGRKLSDFAI
jgi:DNA-binding protein H-NS